MPNNQELVHLPSVEEEQAKDVTVDTSVDSTKPISQWKLLKIIQENERSVISLRELCHMFEFENRYDERLWFGLDQLLRAGRIRQLIGGDGKGNTGVVFEVVKNVKIVSRRESKSQS